MNKLTRIAGLASLIAFPALVLASFQFAAAGKDAESSKDRAGVERAVRDYLEGFYEAKPELIERGVHEMLVKYGYWRRAGETEWHGTAMNFDQARQLASTFNADGKQVPADAPREIVVLDLLDQTASAKLTATWGIDYFHLVKEDGNWKILQVLWQSAPEKKE
jgi:hypothetical protein